jgi:tRNA A37 threonylcarbamoyladenosine dehydratase
MKFAAGGTGGYVSSLLYRLLHTLNRSVKVIIADGDIVEQKNLVRQNFISADLGRNKTQGLAERYASAFGMEARYIPDFIESEARLTELVCPDFGVDCNYYPYRPIDGITIFYIFLTEFDID